MRPRRLFVALAAAVFSLLSLAAIAHESRPAYLEMKESAPGRFSVVWRTPVLAGMRLPVALKLPDGVHDVAEPSVQELPDSRLERRVVDAGPKGLAGRRPASPALRWPSPVGGGRVKGLAGTPQPDYARPPQPWLEIAAPRGALASARVFLAQGIEHILLGVDHLLFVLGLLAIVRTPWMLVKTITAFTLAHSITLAIATFGVASVPAAPLNVAIALSILFLGPEIVRAWRGQTSFTIRHPWVVAFAFGLLHGFGFASGLAALGLPRSEIPLALLAFNAGVEIGQLAFVALVLLLVRSLDVLRMHWPRSLELAPAYVIGSLGAFWTLQRVVLMVEG